MFSTVVCFLLAFFLIASPALTTQNLNSKLVSFGFLLRPVELFFLLQCPGTTEFPYSTFTVLSSGSVSYSSPSSSMAEISAVS